MSAIVRSSQGSSSQRKSRDELNPPRNSRSQDSFASDIRMESKDQPDHVVPIPAAALNNNFMSPVPVPHAPGRPAGAESVPGPTDGGSPQAPSAGDYQPRLEVESKEHLARRTSISLSKKESQQVMLQAETWQQTLLLTLEEPQTSCASQVVSYVVLSTICISIISFVLEAEPALLDFEGWKYIEIFCTMIFTVEYVLRFIVCNAFGEMTRCEFIRSPMNVMDILAILPWYIDIALSGMDLGPLRVLRSVRLVRIFRIFRLSKYSMGMSLMLQSLAASVQPLLILLFFLFIGVTLFSSMIYYAEKMFCPDMKVISDAERISHYQQCTNAEWDLNGRRCCDKYGAAIGFESILDSAWWTIVTMTTVGYGDKAPKTKLGHLIGVCTMICGIVLIALPVTIVGSKFQAAYEAAQIERERTFMDEKDRKAMDVASKVQSGVTKLSGVRKLLSHEGLHGAGQAVTSGTDLVEKDTEPSASSTCRTKDPGELTGSAAAHGEGSKGDDGPEILEKVPRLRENLRKLYRRTALSGAAREQIRLILNLLDHIETTETKLATLREKDAAMEVCMSQTFTHLCRMYEMSRRQVHSELRSKGSSW